MLLLYRSLVLVTGSHQLHEHRLGCGRLCLDTPWRVLADCYGVSKEWSTTHYMAIHILACCATRKWGPGMLHLKLPPCKDQILLVMLCFDEVIILYLVCLLAVPGMIQSLWKQCYVWCSAVWLTHSLASLQCSTLPSAYTQSEH